MSEGYRLRSFIPFLLLQCCSMQSTKPVLEYPMTSSFLTSGQWKGQLNCTLGTIGSINHHEEIFPTIFKASDKSYQNCLTQDHRILYFHSWLRHAFKCYFLSHSWNKFLSYTKIEQISSLSSPSVSQFYKTSTLTFPGPWACPPADKPAARSRSPSTCQQASSESVGF